MVMISKKMQGRMNAMEHLLSSCNTKLTCNDNDLQKLIDTIKQVKLEKRLKLFKSPYIFEDSTGTGGNHVASHADRQYYSGSFRCDSLLELVARATGSYYWVDSILQLLPEKERTPLLVQKDSQGKTIFQRLQERWQHFPFQKSYPLDKANTIECANEPTYLKESSARNALLASSVPFEALLAELAELQDLGKRRERLVSDPAMKEAEGLGAGITRARDTFLKSSKNDDALKTFSTTCLQALADTTHLQAHVRFKKFKVSCVDALISILKFLHFPHQATDRLRFFSLKSKIADKVPEVVADTENVQFISDHSSVIPGGESCTDQFTHWSYGRKG